MSTGETAREQSPQKVSSTFLLKLAPSCVCNSIFKPADCQSRCAELPAHASGFGAQCRGGVGTSGTPRHGQGAQCMGRGHYPPRLCSSARGVHGCAAPTCCSQAACEASCLLCWLQGTEPQPDRQTETPAQMQAHAGGVGAGRWRERSERKEEGESVCE